MEIPLRYSPGEWTESIWAAGYSTPNTNLRIIMTTDREKLDGVGAFHVEDHPHVQRVAPVVHPLPNCVVWLSSPLRTDPKAKHWIMNWKVEFKTQWTLLFSDNCLGGKSFRPKQHREHPSQTSASLKSPQCCSIHSIGWIIPFFVIASLNAVLSVLFALTQTWIRFGISLQNLPNFPISSAHGYSEVGRLSNSIKIIGETVYDAELSPGGERRRSDFAETWQLDSLWIWISFEIRVRVIPILSVSYLNFQSWWAHDSEEYLIRFVFKNKKCFSWESSSWSFRSSKSTSGIDTWCKSPHCWWNIRELNRNGIDAMAPWFHGSESQRTKLISDK